MPVLEPAEKGLEMLKLSGKFSKKTSVKVWGKTLTGVCPDKRGGFAFAGPWLPKDGWTEVVAAEDGAIVVLCADRGTPVYWLCRVGGTEEISYVSDWSGVVEGRGTLLYHGTSVADAIEAAKGAGIPVVETVETPSTPVDHTAIRPMAFESRARARANGRVCGYTGKWRPSDDPICPHCGDDC